MKSIIKNLTIKQKNIIAGTIAIWGIILIGSGTVMTLSVKQTTTTKQVKLKVVQKRIAEIKSNEIKLKDIELEINQPLSVNVKDYLQNPNDIEEKIIKALKLDTSMVNIANSGTYTYTVTYKSKKFTGQIIIKEKQLPETTMTLKNLSLKVGSTLSTDIQTYIIETLSDEVKANTKIDLSNINTAQGGNYQYSVTYNGKLYTGTITIYEPQKITPTETPKENITTNEEANKDVKEDENK